MKTGTTNFFISKKKNIELDQLSESFGAVDTINSNCTTMLAEISQENHVIMTNERIDNQRFDFNLASHHRLYCLLFLNLFLPFVCHFL